MLRFVLCVALLVAMASSCTRSCRAADDPVALVVDLVGRDDADFRAIGLDRIRHAARGEAATRTFAGLLPTQAPERQIALVRALADRGDAAALPGLTALLGSSADAGVRAAAIAALGVLGSGGEVPVLTKALSAADPERAAARRALTILRGNDAVAQLVEALKAAAPGLRPVLIDILADRRARVILPDLTTFTTDADAATRQAAVRALGGLGGAAQVPALIAALVKTPAGGERQEAERAVVNVCTKNDGREQAAQVFLDTFKAASEADRETLLPALGGIGGAGALAIVDDLIASPDAAKRQFGLKAISRWPDATVSSRLLDLVGKASDPAERDLLLGALIRIAPLPDNKLNDGQKLDLVKKTMALCQKDEDRARLIERTNAIRTIDSFRFVIGFLDTPALAEPACKSVVEFAHHRQLRDANKDEFTKALDKVIGTTKNQELVDRANAYKAGKTWERKKG